MTQAPALTTQMLEWLDEQPRSYAETLDAAFATNRDPFTGHAPEAPYEALFSRIVNLVPAPLGLGAAWWLVTRLPLRRWQERST